MTDRVGNAFPRRMSCPTPKPLPSSSPCRQSSCPYADDVESSCSELHCELRAQRRRALAAEEKSCELQARVYDACAKAEIEDERRFNQLVRRLSVVKREKEDAILRAEEEGERVANRLHSKLKSVISERAALERRMETELEFIVNRLNRRLTEAKSEISGLKMQNARQRDRIDGLLVQADCEEKAAAESKRFHLELSKLRRQKVQSESEAEVQTEALFNALSTALNDVHQLRSNSRVKHINEAAQILGQVETVANRHLDEKLSPAALSALRDRLATAVSPDDISADKIPQMAGDRGHCPSPESSQQQLVEFAYDVLALLKMHRTKLQQEKEGLLLKRLASPAMRSSKSSSRGARSPLLQPVSPRAGSHFPGGSVSTAILSEAASSCPSTPRSMPPRKLQQSSSYMELYCMREELDPAAEEDDSD